jgi:multidrug resistance efflux pump
VAIARGRATLVRRERAGEPDSVLAPIRANFDAAEADLNVAEAKLDAAAARIELAEHRLAEARDKARSADRPRRYRPS